MWTGMEMNCCLSDILGTDEDIIYRDLENEVERKLLKKSVRKIIQTGADDHRTAVWT